MPHNNCSNYTKIIKTGKNLMQAYHAEFNRNQSGGLGPVTCGHTN